MASGSEIQVGAYVIHLTRAEEGLWRVVEMTDRALSLENPKGERRAINVAFSHHLVLQDPERFEVQAAFERAALLRLAGEDPAALITKLARQYGTVTVRDIREQLEPLFASKEAFRKWWAARTTKSSLALAPRLEFLPPSTYRYLETPRSVPVTETAETPSPPPPMESTPWSELADVIESGDGSGAVANRIKWRHVAGLLRAIQAGRAAEWEADAAQTFLTTVLLDDRLAAAERLRAATELYQSGWIQEEEVKSLGLEFWAPPAETVSTPPPEPSAPPARTRPEPPPRLPGTPPRTEAAPARRPAAPGRVAEPEAPPEPATALIEMVLASTQLPPNLWGANMERMAARMLSLLTSDPAQLASGGRLDVFSRSLGEVASQCEALSMTPLALRLLAHPAMPLAWKSSLLDTLYEQAPESANQVHRALRADPGASGLYLRSLQRRWEKGSFAILIEEMVARELASPQRPGLWNFAMHELAEGGDGSPASRVLGILLADAAPDDEAREQATSFLDALTGGVPPPPLRAREHSPETNGQHEATDDAPATDVAALTGFSTQRDD